MGIFTLLGKMSNKVSMSDKTFHNILMSDEMSDTDLSHKIPVKIFLVNHYLVGISAAMFFIQQAYSALILMPLF